MTDDEALVRSLIEDRIPALHAKDAGRVLSPYAEDALFFELQPPLRYAGLEALNREMVAAWLATWQGPVACELRDLDVRADGNLAFCHGLQRLSGTKLDGASDDIWVRLTVCLRRIDGAWKIVHEHLSVPFHMDGSYRAAVDLKP